MVLDICTSSPYIDVYTVYILDHFMGEFPGSKVHLRASPVVVPIAQVTARIVKGRIERTNLGDVCAEAADRGRKIIGKTQRSPKE